MSLPFQAIKPIFDIAQVTTSSVLGRGGVGQAEVPPSGVVFPPPPSEGVVFPPPPSEEEVPPPEPVPQGMTAGQIAIGLLSLVGMATGAYHGYKRNNSVGWAVGWGLLGGLAPIITIPVSVAQGFGKRAK